MTTKPSSVPGDCVTDQHHAFPSSNEAAATERAAAAFLVAGLAAADASPSPRHFVPLEEFLSRV